MKLSKKLLFFVAIAFFAFSFCVFADFIEAKEMTQEEISQSVKLSKADRMNILNSLPQALTNEWIDLVVSASNAEDQAIVLILREAVRGKIRDYLLVEAPRELGIEIVKIGYKLGKIAFTADMSALLKELESMTVKESLKYLGEWLNGNKIKVGAGNINFSYKNNDKEEQKHKIQYIIVFKPESEKKGEAIIKIYSKNYLDAPSPKGSIGGAVGVGGIGIASGEISPFILTIKGSVNREQIGWWKSQFMHQYSWVSQPDISISFPSEVPEFDFKEKGFFEKIGDSITGFFKKIGNFFGRASIIEPPNINIQEGPGILAEIRALFEDILEQLKLISERLSQSQQEELGQKLKQEIEEIEQEGDLEELAKKLADLKARLDALFKEMNQAEAQDEDEEDKEEEKGEKGLIINQVCAGFNKSSNEFVQIYNPTDKNIILQGNFKLKLVNSSNNSTNKSIDWIKTEIPAKAYFLLVGGELIVNNKALTPDAKFSSQLTSVSGVIIEDKDGNILDKVAWGTKSKSPPQSAVETKGKILENGLLTDQSLARKNYIDTNNNELDFQLIDSPAPINSLFDTIILTQNEQGESEGNEQEEQNNSGSTGGGGSRGGSGDSNGGTISPSPKILISEVQIERETKLQDFVELYNPSNNSVDISHWRLKKRNQKGTESSIRVFPDGSFIPGKGYFLWVSSKDENYSSSLGADVFSTAYLTENESIALFDKQQEIIDAIAWGSGHDGAFVEGQAIDINPRTRDIVGEWLDEIGFTGTRTPNPSFIFYQSIGRKVSPSDGYQDTDNNIDDFEIQNPTPKAENETFIEPILQDILEEIDSTPPETEITSSPPVLTNQIEAIFSFKSNEEGSTFECRLDAQDWESCDSPKTYSDCSEGQHQFLVRATDLFLNTDITPAEYIWTVDTDIESPIISLFDLDTDSEFYTNERTVGVIISIPVFEQGLEWLLSENSEIPVESSPHWQTIEPETFILSEFDGTKTVYIWSKDGVGNISVLGNSSSIVLDTLAPSSQVIDLEEIQDSIDFSVSWSGSDVTGIAYYDIQVKDSLINIWQDWKDKTNEANAQFIMGEDGHTYYFRSRAEDLAGNLEDWPGSEQGDTFALVDLSGQDDDGQDDDSGQDDNATSTSTNATSSFANGLIISEVRANGTDEFVEIYNPTDQEIPLDGLYLSYFSENRDWNDPYINYAFPTSTIASQEYYLIGFGEYPKTGEPVADWDSSGGNLSNYSGAIGIFSRNPKNSSTSTEAGAKAEIFKIDALGWGNPIVKEGEPAVTSGTDKSLIRKIEPDLNGYLEYIDTNNNKSDFSSQISTPGVQNLHNYSDLDGDGIIDSFDATTTISQDIWLLAGEYSFKNLEIIDSANLFVLSDVDLIGFKGVKIIAENLFISKNSSINADNNGYSDAIDESRNYSNPITLGSAGEDIHISTGSSCSGTRHGGNGGGAIILEISSILDVLGTISANGEQGLKNINFCPASDSGNGGSIYVTANVIKGSGKIETNSGNAYDTGDSGAGGQIALYYNQNQFTGDITAFGRTNNYMNRTGNTGTVYFSSTQDKLVIKNQKNNGVYLLENSLSGLNELEFDNTKVAVSAGVGLQADEILIKNSLFEAGIQEVFDITANNFSLINSGIVANLNIQTTELWIDSNSYFSADVIGYQKDEGPGCGLLNNSGASYGGIGGKNSTSSIYGSSTKPIDFGSGAKSMLSTGRPGGAGAGKIFIRVADNFQLDGEIRANGEDGKLKTGGGPAMGGGSGGSVYIIANNFFGSGTIYANGGKSSSFSGAGGGGRIAVYSDNIGFSGVIEALGGTQKNYSVYAGGDGTVYLK